MFSSQILQNPEINIAGIGNFEENMDLSQIYLAVHVLKVVRSQNRLSSYDAS